MKVINTAGQVLQQTGGGGGGAAFTGGFSTQGNTLGNTGMVTGQLLMVGTNNITLSGSTNAGSITVSISGPSQSIQTQGITGDQLSLGASTGGNTAGNTTVQTGQRFVFVGSNMISLSQATGAGSTTLTFNATQSVQTQGITGDELSVGVSTGGNTQGNTTVNSGQRFVLVGTNGITLSQATGAGSTTISISGNAAQTTQSAIKGFGASNTGNTLGNTGISTGIDWVIAGTNNITVSESTVGGGPNTIWLSGPNAGAGNVTFSAGTSSGGFASLVFSDSNLVSFGLDGSTITANKFLNFSAGTTSNNISSQISFANSNGISFGLNASTITASVKQGTASHWFQNCISIAGNAIGQNTLRVAYSAASNFISASAAKLLFSISQSTSSNSSYAIGLSVRVGIFTMNVSTLSLASSGSQSYAWTITSNNTTANQAGQRMVTVPININVTPGDYWIGTVLSTSSANANWASFTNYFLTGPSGLVTASGILGVAGNATSAPIPGIGDYTSTTNAMPNTLDLRSFSGIGNGQLPAWLYFYNTTA